MPAPAGGEAAGGAELQQSRRSSSKSVFAPQPAAARRPACDDLVEDRQPARVGGDDVIKTVKRDEPKVGRNDPVLVRQRQEIQEVPRSLTPT